MQDLKSDFYKRYSHTGGCCDEIFIPSSVTLLGTDNESSALPILSLALGFGAHAAYRKRSDDRLIWSDSNSDILHSKSKSEIDSEDSDIFKILTSLPVSISGFEMLLQSDTDDDYLSSEKLCAASAAADMSGYKYSPAVIVHAAQANARGIVSLNESSRMAVINTATLDYIPLDACLEKYKIVIARINTRRRDVKTGNSFRERELERVNSAIEQINKGSFDGVFRLLLESSRDMLNSVRSHPAGLLFEICAELCFGVRLMNDMRGTIAFVPAEKVDEYTRLADNLYEKKAGTRPAFYISD